jgi:hypothetical protein
MPPVGTISISPAVEEVLRRSTVRDNVLFLPPGQLDRKLYEAVDKVIGLLGGKWKSGKIKGHVFDSDPGLLLEEALDSGEVLDAKKHFQAFFTPAAVADLMVNLAGIGPDSTGLFLEPSAGGGALIAAALRVAPAMSCHACEIQDDLRSKLAEQFVNQSVGFFGDFLAFTPPPSFIGYPIILANPPFTRGQAIQHASRMLDLLAPGGRLVCVLPSGVLQKSDKATGAFISKLTSLCPSVIWKGLDEGAFKESGTLVRTQLLIAKRAA